MKQEYRPMMKRFLWYVKTKRHYTNWIFVRLARLALLLPVLVPVVLLVISLVNAYERQVRHRDCTSPPVANSLSRLLKDNIEVESGQQEYLIPNYVHLYRFGQDSVQLSALDIICLLSIYQHQKPDKMVIHTDNVQAVRNSFTNSYYGTRLWSVPGFHKVLEVVEYQTPKHVFGLPFSEEYKHLHISDFVRLQILRKYGGIFLDNHVYLAKQVNNMRKEELAVTMAEDSTIENSLIVSHRDSRLLELWVKSYVHYNDDRIHHHHSPQVEQLLKNAHQSLVKLVPHAMLITSVKEFPSKSPFLLPYYVVRLNVSENSDQDLDSDLVHRLLPP